MSVLRYNIVLLLELARIDDILDAWDSDGCFSDVCCDDAFPCALGNGLKCFVLLRR